MNASAGNRYEGMGQAGKLPSLVGGTSIASLAVHHFGSLATRL